MQLHTTVKKRKVISESAENTIRDIASHHSGKFRDIGDVHSKVRGITFFRKGVEETIFYMRHTGLGKGHLQVIVRPQIGQEIDRSALNQPGVKAHVNKNFARNPRLVFNSNFSAYKNKGQEPTRGEHAGWAYIVDISENYDSFERFCASFTE